VLTVKYISLTFVTQLG